MAQKIKPNVVPFRRVLDAEPELTVGLPPTAAPAQVVTERPATVVDLSDKPKAWLLIGPGRVGKTMLARFVAEMVANRGGQAIYAAADPQNRSLVQYLDDVAQPATNDAAATTRWLEQLIRHAMSEAISVVCDLGGGDTSLGRLLADMPDLATVMEAGGIAPVAVYILGPRVDDLASLASFEARGFRPPATAIVMNEGLADPATPREDSFARILRHSAFRSALDRGSMHLWMPALDPAVTQEIEAKRLGFMQARDAVSPESRKVTPLGPFDRSRVRRWLDIMTAEFGPIMSWLPS